MDFFRKAALAACAISTVGSFDNCWLARADVVLDGSTGTGGSIRGPDHLVPPEVGRRSGGNLFHSFERFDIRRGESATFTGPAGIENVIGRVTGGERSRINGALRSTIPGADFWFLNPAGVVFGPEATLDLQGSFHVSTADELRFSDGTALSTTDPTSGSFTVARPEAFGFLGPHTAKISLVESLLNVRSGRVLSVVGGEVNIKGGDVARRDDEFVGNLTSLGGQINVASLTGTGFFELDNAFLHGRGGAIHVFDDGVVTTSGPGGGDVRLLADHITIRDQTFIFARNTGDQASKLAFF